MKFKGFDEITDYIYMTNHTTEVMFENINRLKHSDGNNPFVSAPTIFQTVQWLYEKHNIWIYVSNVPFENHFTFEYSINNKEKCLHQYGTFESPEEAYESAIEYCLEQII